MNVAYPLGWSPTLGVHTLCIRAPSAGIGGRRGRRRRRALWAIAQRPNVRQCEAVVCEARELTPARRYRERRREVKLVRRARDRAIARRLQAHYGTDPDLAAVVRSRGGWRVEGRSPGHRKDEVVGHMVVADPLPWWATSTGRRAWLREDRERKATRRSRTRTP